MKQEVIGTILSYAGYIASILIFFYYKNEKVYLFVQRVLLKFKPQSKAFIDVKISLKSKNEISFNNLADIKISHAKIHTHSKKIIFNENGNAREFNFQISKTHYEETEVFIYAKYPIYSMDYDKEFENIRMIYRPIKEKYNQLSSNIDFSLQFDGHNPYEGFFVKQIPGTDIDNFSISLNIDGVKVEARKNTIITRSSDIDALIRNTLNILMLKTPIVTTK